MLLPMSFRSLLHAAAAEERVVGGLTQIVPPLSSLDRPHFGVCCTFYTYPKHSNERTNEDEENLGIKHENVREHVKLQPWQGWNHTV